MSAFPAGTPALRPLPPRPSLEYERKEAKALLRRLRAGESESVERARARHPALDHARARLADAQLVLAREYGFASWPRLVHYFEAVERQQHARSQLHGDVRAMEGWVRWVLAGHEARRSMVGRMLAAYVPRFYGLRPEEVLAGTIREDDARLAVARMQGEPSWELLIERVATLRPWPGPFDPDPLRDASATMRTGDVGALERVVAEHPELLTPSRQDQSAGRTLIAAALALEQHEGVDAARPIVEWLEERGFSRQRELDARLCGGMGLTTETVHELLARGANPNAIAPTGLPVLEHALLRYWNGAAVDVLAARATPRRALWIAAGLGDVAGVRGFLDRWGRPTAAARKLRPDFDAAGPRGAIPALPDADDEEILVEALLVAVFNGRTEVIEYLASRGTPVNSLVFDTPLVSLAAGNTWVASTEALLRCGADPDLRGAQNGSARELARMLFEQRPHDDASRRIAVLCGLDPDAVLAERDARPPEPPQRSPMFNTALALAADDAARLGQAEVRPENLLVGVLRVDAWAMHLIASPGGVNVTRLRADFAARLRAEDDRVIGGDSSGAPPFGADADSVVARAVALATGRRQDIVHGAHLLAALLGEGDGPVVELLTKYGGTSETLRVDLSKW